MIYLGEVRVRVDLDPEAMGCSDVTADNTSCTATITSDEIYTVSLTVTNDLDSTMTMRDFDCEFIHCMYVCILYVQCMYMYVCTCVYMCVHVCTCMYTCMCVRTYTCTCVCMYVHVCMYVCMYVHAVT